MQHPVFPGQSLKPGTRGDAVWVTHDGAAGQRKLSDVAILVALFVASFALTLLWYVPALRTKGAAPELGQPELVQVAGRPVLTAGHFANSPGIADPLSSRQHSADQAAVAGSGSSAEDSLHDQEAQRLPIATAASPADARRASEDCASHLLPPDVATGPVSVLVHVLPSGHVTESRLERGSGDDQADRDLLRCLEEMDHLAPTMVQGHPVAGWQRIGM